MCQNEYPLGLYVQNAIPDLPPTPKFPLLFVLPFAQTETASVALCLTLHIDLPAKSTFTTYQESDHLAMAAVLARASTISCQDYYGGFLTHLFSYLRAHLCLFTAQQSA